MFVNARSLLVLLCCAAVWLPAAAIAQDAETRALVERLERLERDLRTMQRAVYRGETPAPAGGGAAPSTATGAGRLADAEVRMSRIESEMRAMTGRIEELRFGISNLAQRVDKLITDVDFRLTQIEQGAQPAAGAAQPPAGAATATGADAGAAAQGDTQTAAVSGVLPEGTAMEQYNFARSLLRKLDFEGAEGAFREFLELHPDDKLAGNALYWLGETYYARGQLDDAARVFLDGYRRFPDGNKAPDVLLKLAITLRKMDQTEEACATLGELGKKFPDVSPPLRNRMTREVAAAACP